MELINNQFQNIDMNVKEKFKLKIGYLANIFGVNRVLRFAFRRNILVIMYHGVTAKNYKPAAWTQLPINIFEEQIKWLLKNYTPVSLSHVVDAVANGSVLPDNSVLLTFDDGLKNNISVAYPVLEKYKFPAAIFLTVDLVDTEFFLWFDELYIIIKEAKEKGIKLELSLSKAKAYFEQGRYWEAYCAEVEHLKRKPLKDCLQIVTNMLNQISYEKQKYCEDFGPLSWQDVITLDKKGLVEFGVHTATHRILTTIPETQLEDELLGAKNRLEKQLGHKVDTFCYPNGSLGRDYLPEHRYMLKEFGYKCAFATDLGLYDLQRDNEFSIPRIAVGNDISAKADFFQMNASGLCNLRTLIQKHM